MKTIAVIVAHPDDEVLGCGGSIARFSREGWSVHILIMATGLTSRGTVSQTELSKLRQNAQNAAATLNASNIEFYNFPDNAMDTCPLLEVVKSVELFLAKVEPDLIFTHHDGDINIDHDITQRAVMTAARALPKTKPVEILACEILSSSDFGPAEKPIKPHYYIRLDENDVEASLRALECYEGELRAWPHPRSTEALNHQLRLRGAECGATAAEVFEVLKVTR